jgi:replicative DNA helicase
MKNDEKNKYLNLEYEPNNFFAEEALLSIILRNPHLMKTVSGILKPPAFYSEPNRIIYEIFLDLINQNNTINFTNLISTLQDKNLLKKVGGMEKLEIFLNRFDNPLDLDIYIQHVNDKYLRRILVDFGKQIITWGYTTSEEFETILEKIEKQIFEFTQQQLSQKIYTSKEILNDIYSQIKAKKDHFLGFETSFTQLDSILQGFQKSDLIIIAGRPSMGKTAFALNIGKNIVKKYKIPLIIFTLEMSRDQMMYRLLSNEANISSTKIKSGKMTKSEWSILSASLNSLGELPIHVDDNAHAGINEIRSKIKKILITNKNNGLVIIDYLQLMKSSLPIDNRVQEISYITRNLKLLAKDFQIPILLLSQLSRNVESRVNKRPMLSDLRESGCIAQKEKLDKKVENNNPFHDNFGWNNNGIYSLSKRINCVPKGIKPIFQIIFENELNILITANHKLLSTDGWLKISELNTKSKIYSIELTKNSLQVIKYQTIKKIYYKGIDIVYDKNIPFFHNYIKNNICLHNSIEQDADVVIMIYRDDYYSKQNEPNRVTEFIVAKHRNGPIGTATLAFYPETSSFKNI